MVAAAAGTVEVSAHQGSVNGYGNLVVIDHGGGYSTYYAHLDTRAVTAGAVGLPGQAIGAVGNTSKPGNGISPAPALRGALPGPAPSRNIIKAVFNGSTFGYLGQR